jgi:hypothetical protein
MNELPVGIAYKCPGINNNWHLIELVESSFVLGSIRRRDTDSRNGLAGRAWARFVSWRSGADTLAPGRSTVNTHGLSTKSENVNVRKNNLKKETYVSSPLQDSKTPAS